MNFSAACELYDRGQFKEAFDLFLQCDLTDSDVQRSIGYLYLAGEGVTQDGQKAAE